MSEKELLSTETPPTSRRDFLSLTWKTILGLSSVLGLAGVIEYFSYLPDPSAPTLFDLGPVDQLPRDSIIIVQQAQAALIPTTEGFQAFSLVCPHLGCQVELKDERFDCPCHGSRFSIDGSLLRGPATSPLRALSFEISAENHLILNTSET